MRPTLAVAFLTALLVSACASAPDDRIVPVEPVLGTDVDPTMAQAAFERLKTLAGRWVHTAPEGSEGLGNGSVVTYEVTASGNAVLETEFAGAEHEMLTIYTLDQGQLVLTHYCGMNNQPHMVATAIPDADHLSFQAVSVGNAPSIEVAHMHWAEIEFVDEDHVRTRWTIRKPGGEPGFVGEFDLRRAVE